MRLAALARRDFPFALVRRVRFAHGLACPRCTSPRVHRWGRFGRRRRYRCLACRRTFSDFTGTPLAYLKRIDRWAAFCACVLLGLTIRRAAARLGLHKDTVFRWRHRLLAALRTSESPHLRGTIALEETWFAYSEKGRRRLDRPARRRGSRALSFQGPVAWVLMAWDEHGTAAGDVVGHARPRRGDVARLLEGRLAPGAKLTSRTPRLGPVAAFARERSFGWRRRGPEDRARAGGADPGYLYVRRLKEWLRRFRGVATRYLPHYLVWFRLLDCPRDPYRVRDHVLAGAFP